MTIKREDEEILRLAGKVINDKIRNYRNLFHRADMQDLLSMVAIEIMTQNLQHSKGTHHESEAIESKLKQIDAQLSEYFT